MPLRPLDRRTLLRASGVAIGLPVLDAMLPARVRAADARAVAPRRVVLVGRPLGMYAPFFFPEKAGKDYEPSRYLKVLEPHRDQFTVFSGVSHRYPAGHFAEVGLFTGVHPDNIRPNEIRNGVSLDQEVAAHVGGHTRFPSLVLGGGDAAWNRRGVRVPAQARATQVFKQLFVRGTPDEEARELRRIRDGRSILDGVREQVATLNTKLGGADRVRLEQYLASVREAEQRLQQDETWVKAPKPEVKPAAPVQDFGGPQLLQRSRQWFELVRLALATDSTRVVSLHLGSQERPEIEGVTLPHHDASHHGQEPTKLEQLALIEEAELKVFGEFLDKMKAGTEGGDTLLGRTAVVYASNLGNSSSHDNTNLPVLLAGGGFRHAGHVAFDRKNNTLLSNLYVRVLHQTGIEAKAFGVSTGVVSEV
ncbi:DUF1552 domain-containing protein [Gemmata sp.]|uniref:DUF1552 domain-containing protein n=1 Tax=Gemmata sp. TaxID=1914242 RepID=UPI003F70B1F3